MLDDGPLWQADRDANDASHRRKGAALFKLPHHCAVLTDPVVPADKAKCDQHQHGLYLSPKGRIDFLGAAGAVAYDVSPVNVIPNCIPVLGQLDDLLVTLLGLVLMKRMIPCELLEICRQQARNVSHAGLLHKTVVPALLVASWALSLS